VSKRTDTPEPAHTWRRRDSNPRRARCGQIPGSTSSASQAAHDRVCGVLRADRRWSSGDSLGDIPSIVDGSSAWTSWSKPTADGKSATATTLPIDPHRAEQHHGEQHHSDDLASRYRFWSGVAEAEGFEPPDGRPSLAFKVVDPVISGDHPSGIGRSSARARSLQGLANRERMQPQMPPLHHASTHDRV
jgi:hypothetical protein